MKLIDMQCTKCGATLQVNPELSKCMCQYCGNEMLIDNEVQKHDVQISNGFDFGYQQEIGRQKAIEDFERQKKEQDELKRKQEQEAKALERKRIEEEIAARIENERIEKENKKIINRVKREFKEIKDALSKYIAKSSSKKLIDNSIWIYFILQTILFLSISSNIFRLIILGLNVLSICILNSHANKPNYFDSDVKTNKIFIILFIAFTLIGLLVAILPKA